MANLDLLLLLLLLCTAPYLSSSFQSDEAQSEDDIASAAAEDGDEEADAEDTLLILKTKNIIAEEQVATARGPRSFSSSSAFSPTDSKIQFEIQHSFGDSEFSPAGSFSARLRNPLLHTGQTLTRLRLSRNAFTAEEQEAFQDLVRADGFYRIRVPTNVLTPTGEWILSSVKARCLASSNLQERFEFYMERGNIIAIGYGASQCAYPRIPNYPKKWMFDSSFVLKGAEQAVRSLPIINEVEVVLGEDGQPIKQVEKSFWAKYWMYIVPLGLILLNAMMQVANMPEEGSTQGSSAAGTAQRTISAGSRRR